VADEDRVFHGIIVGAAHSPRLARLVSDVSELPLDYRLMLWHGRTADERRAAVNDHVELAAVLARRDGVAAETLMRGHLLDAAVQLTAAGR
jgi:DNA-binding GntR family transcriptional regulator